MMKPAVGLVTVALAMAACGGPTSTPIIPTPIPSAPPPEPEPPPPAPLARLAVTVDGASVFTVIPHLDTVNVDASGSSGTGLRFGIDYGDGAGIDEPAGSHVYTGAGAYRVRVLVTDSLGRTDMASVNLVATPLDGLWRNSIYNSAAKRYESRSLRIAFVGGRDLGGTYTHPEGHTHDVSGRFGERRSLTLRLSDGTITFSTPPLGFDAAVSRMQVQVRGGSADGQTLIFDRSGQ